MKNINSKTTISIDSLPSDNYTKEGQEQRLAYLKEKLNCSLEYISGEKVFDNHTSLKGNIERYIGMAQIPIGVIGPLLVNGTYAKGDFHIPLATTEGALIASYNRGVKACRLAGGINAFCLNEGVQRSPFFKFKDTSTALEFVKWCYENIAVFKEITHKTSNHAQLQDLRANIEGNSIILVFQYTTGDASGQNMVTICTDAICNYILQNTPTQPTDWYIESNYSGDKKATALAFSNVRGKKVTTEVSLPKAIVEDVLKTTPEKMANYWQASTLAAVQSGAIGAQGHVANGLAALFIATGQDVACVSESAIGITRMEVQNNGNLYVAVTLPNLIVGTVGGGTGLPTQKEALEMIDCFGKGKAQKFAEICGAVALAGELSIAAALSAGHFTSAHQNLGRKS